MPTTVSCGDKNKGAEIQKYYLIATAMKRLISFVFCALLCAGASAQTTKEKISGFVTSIEMRAGSSKLSFTDHNPKFAAAEWDVLPGYALSRRIAVFVPITTSLGLFNTDGVKSYELAGQLGAGLGYSPLHTPKDQLELSAKAGCSIGGKWHFVYYDFGARYHFGGYQSKSWIGYLGLGVRYFDSFRRGFGDHLGMYVSIGFKFNSYKVRAK